MGKKNLPFPPRLQKVLELTAKGMTNIQISHELGIPLGTVKFQQMTIRLRLCACNRAEVVANGFRRKLLK